MARMTFEISEPQPARSGAIIASPHSGRVYEERFLASTELDAHTLRSSEDAWVDELVAAAPRLGVPLLTAHTPRAYVDLNRNVDELDPALIEGIRRGIPNPRVSSGLGVIPRVVANGRAIYRGRLSQAEARRRLDTHWHPYHKALQGLIDRQLAQFGKVILLDCHSMPHEAIESHSQHLGRTPEVVLGDRFGASAGPDIMSAVEAVFESAGLSVARNTPFAGAFVSQNYGRPGRGQHVIQIEIDRTLYMDERTLVRHEGFDRMQQVMTAVIREVAALAQPQLPLAAE